MEEARWQDDGRWNRSVSWLEPRDQERLVQLLCNGLCGMKKCSLYRSSPPPGKGTLWSDIRESLAQTVQQNMNLARDLEDEAGVSKMFIRSQESPGHNWDKMVEDVIEFGLVPSTRTQALPLHLQGWPNAGRQGLERREMQSSSITVLGISQHALFATGWGKMADCDSSEVPRSKKKSDRLKSAQHCSCVEIRTRVTTNVFKHLPQMKIRPVLLTFIVALKHFEHEHLDSVISRMHFCSWLKWFISFFVPSLEGRSASKKWRGWTNLPLFGAKKL